MSDNFIYDEVPYPSFTFSQTHPDRLATIAKLHGMNPANVENCRVLELGCGDGSNLIWIAHTIPNSTFVGIDLSAKHIADAKLNAKEIGVANIEFHAADVMTLSADSFGKFDYIIAHGLFSWVPDFVREKVLQIYREMLNPNGIGYISYNAYPGCHLRDLTRNMMRFHVKDLLEPMRQVEESLKFLEFLGETVEQGSVYQEIIKQEFSKMTIRTPENIFHDDLSDLNQPFYFADFAANAEKHDLQFLSEAEFFSTQSQHFPAKIQELLATFGDDVIKIEQYLDFIKSRRFRQTLLVHKEIAVKRNIDPQILREFLIASPVRCDSNNPKLSGNTVEKFVGTKTASFQMDHPLTKAALFHLGKIWTKSIPFGELIKKSRELLKDEPNADSPENIETTAAILFKLFAADFVKLHVYQPVYVNEISRKPNVSEFARWQAKNGNMVSTLNGLSLSIEDDLVRALLLLLDGTRDKGAILAALKKNPKTQNFKNLPVLLENNLSQIAKNALLVG